MENTITLRECLNIMDAGLPFSIKVQPYDEKRDLKGRERGWIELQEAMSIRTISESDKDETHAKRVKKSKRNSNHRYHATRNIRIAINKKPIGDITKIHVDLIVRFNGRKLILP
jgi:hypothetical protein